MNMDMTTMNMDANSSCNCNCSDDYPSDDGSPGYGTIYDAHMKRAHGCAMLTGWVLFSAIGIFMPRYFRRSLAGRKIGSAEIWFILHRVFMVMTLVCTVVGFIIIFVDNSGSWMPFPVPQYPAYFSAHAPIGIAVMVLVILQPVMALFRCSPDADWRPLFNWVHLIVGSVTQILAFITMLIGLQIATDEGLLQSTIVFWILVSFIAFHLFIENLSNKTNVAALINVNVWIPGIGKSENAEEGANTTAKCIQIIYAVVAVSLWITMMVLVGLGI